MNNFYLSYRAKVLNSRHIDDDEETEVEGDEEEKEEENQRALSTTTSWKPTTQSRTNPSISAALSAVTSPAAPSSVFGVAVSVNRLTKLLLYAVDKQSANLPSVSTPTARLATLPTLLFTGVF